MQISFQRVVYSGPRISLDEAHAVVIDSEVLLIQQQNLPSLRSTRAERGPCDVLRLNNRFIRTERTGMSPGPALPHVSRVHAWSRSLIVLCDGGLQSVWSMDIDTGAWAQLGDGAGHPPPGKTGSDEEWDRGILATDSCLLDSRLHVFVLRQAQQGAPQLTLHRLDVAIDQGTKKSSWEEVSIMEWSDPIPDSLIVVPSSDEASILLVPSGRPQACFVYWHARNHVSVLDMTYPPSHPIHDRSAKLAADEFTTLAQHMGYSKAVPVRAECEIPEVCVPVAIGRVVVFMFGSTSQFGLVQIGVSLDVISGRVEPCCLSGDIPTPRETPALVPLSPTCALIGGGLAPYPTLSSRTAAVTDADFLYLANFVESKSHAQSAANILHNSMGEGFRINIIEGDYYEGHTGDVVSWFVRLAKECQFPFQVMVMGQPALCECFTYRPRPGCPSNEYRIMARVRSASHIHQELFTVDARDIGVPNSQGVSAALREYQLTQDEADR